MRFLLLVCCLVGLSAAKPIDWWDSPRYGANSFNGQAPDRQYFDALRGYSAEWVRLTYDKWKSSQRDYLIGDADDYDGLVEADFAKLRATLDRADAAGLKVVIAPLSLPGARWTQNNGNVHDTRLWTDKRYWKQAQDFWRDLAGRLKGRPAIAAYNIVNEPTPEWNGGLPEHPAAAAAARWYERSRGTARDLPAFYATVVAAIREVDPDTPIMLDGGWYAAADGFAYWPGPLDDPAILYAFHMYEPYAATSAPNLRRASPFAYPGDVPFAERTERWDAARVAAYIGQPLVWADTHGVARNRVVAAEFGCMRRLPLCPTYLEDVLSALDSAHVHWAFYAFREDVWDAMDYELGNNPVPSSYWDDPSRVERGPTQQFAPILKRLRRTR